MGLGLRDVVLVGELVKGLGVTLRHLFKPPVTIQYPTQRRQTAPRFRGLLRWDESKCVACVLCAHYCPAKAINIVTGEKEDGAKKVMQYRLDAARCMVCGLCAEICPVGALAHSPHYELAAYEREDMVYIQERMSGNPPIIPYR